MALFYPWAAEWRQLMRAITAMSTVLVTIENNLVATNKNLVLLTLQGTQMAETVASIGAELAGLKTDFEAFRDAVAAASVDLKAQIAALQAQLAGGIAVSQADLDGISASVAAIDTEVKAAGAPPAP